MGLSDEERYEKIIWAIRRITELPVPDTFKPMIDRLWHAYLGTTSNNAFWIIGGDATNPITESGAPFATAVKGHFENARHKENAWPRINDHVTISTFLENEHKAVYELYTWTEQLCYALRRYDDDLKRNYAALDQLICSIQGLCFAHFAQHQCFAEAYLADRIVDWIKRDYELYERINKYPYQGWLIKALKGLDLEELMELDLLTLRLKPTRNNAVAVYMKLALPEIEYEHQFKNLLTDFHQNIDAKILSEQFKVVWAAREQAKKEEHKAYSENARLSQAYAIHGYDWERT